MDEDKDLPAENTEAKVRAKKYLSEKEGEGQEDSESTRYNVFKRKIKEIREHFGQYFDNPRKIAYLAAIAATGKVMKSAEIAGITRQTICAWRGDVKAKTPPDNADIFRELELDASEYFNELLLSEIDRRAIDGFTEPIYYQGEKVGERRKYSDNLLMFRTKARMPEYKDSQAKVNINSEKGTDLEIKFTVPDEVKEMVNTEDIEDEEVIDLLEEEEE